jgi:hypothetical protein
LRLAVELAISLRPRILSPSDLAFFLYWTRRLHGEIVADPFWISVATADGLRSGTPAYALYKRLMDSTQAVAKLPREIRLGICIKAFNAYITDRPMKCLRVSEYEEFPRFEKA